jgi:dienelactone hydrolase
MRAAPLALAILFLGCSGDEALSPQPITPPTLEAFSVEFMGITGVRPEGWVETYPGTFKRSGNQGDLTVLAQRSYPGIDTEWLLEYTLLSELGPLRSLPGTFDSRQANGLSWRLYSTTVELSDESWQLDVGLAETETHSFVIVLLMDEEDYPTYHEGVFVSAVDGYVFGSDSEPAPPDAAVQARFDYDSTLPLNVQETQQSTVEGITEIQLTYDSPAGGRVPATLMIPEGEGPFPGMVYQHGFPSNRQGIRPLALDYARQGVVTIAIDAPWARPEASDRSYPLTFSETDALEQVQLMMDLSRALDLLEERQDVDPDRLVYVGVSYGGAMGGLLAGVESRLKACVLVVGDGGLIEHFFGLEDVLYGQGEFESAQEQRAWFDAMWPVEPLNFIGQSAPVALLFQNGRTDLAVPAPDAIRYQRRGSQPKTIIWYDTGHSLPPQLIADQEEWLRQYITLQ